MRGKLAVIAGLLALVATPAVASVNYYLKIEGLSGAVSQGGKSTLEPIEIQSFHLATLAAGIVAVGGANTSHPPSPIVIVRKVDKASPLFAQCARSCRPSTATITAVDAGKIVETVVLSDALVSSYQLNPASGGAQTETLTLVYTKITDTKDAAGSDGTWGAATPPPAGGGAWTH